MPRSVFAPLTRIAAAWLLFAVCASAASAQTLSERLSTLLTEQRPDGVFVPDPAAAATTRDTFARLVAVELATVPVASSAGGFVFQLRPDLGVFARASNEFGPFFTERVLRNSRGQGALGFNFQTSRFGSLQGRDLGNGTFPANAARTAGTTTDVSVDTVSLDLDARSLTSFASYGVTDRLAVGLVVPVVHVRFEGRRMRSAQGAQGLVSVLQSSQSGSATGLGDVAANARYLVVGQGTRGVSVGADVRFPTGNERNLLGSSRTAARVLGLGSFEEERLSVHLNAGVGVGGVSREVFWSTATTLAVHPRVTVVGEMMGRYLSELSRIEDVYQAHSTVPGLETMRWIPVEQGLHSTFVAVGAKWNVARSFLVNSNVLIRLSEGGLRAAVTPAISLDYAFRPFRR